MLGGRGGGVWPSGSQSNALPSPPRYLCCSLHAFSVCVIVHLELWFSYFFFSFLHLVFFSFFFIASIRRPSVRPSVFVLYILPTLLTHALPGPCR